MGEIIGNKIYWDLINFFLQRGLRGRVLEASSSSIVKKPPFKKCFVFMMSRLFHSHLIQRLIFFFRKNQHQY